MSAREPVVDRLDETIGKVLLIAERWATDPKGPSNQWVQGLANVVLTLVKAREILVAQERHL